MNTIRCYNDTTDLAYRTIQYGQGRGHRSSSTVGKVARLPVTVDDNNENAVHWIVNRSSSCVIFQPRHVGASSTSVWGRRPLTSTMTFASYWKGKHPVGKAMGT